MRYHPISESEMLVILSNEEMDYCYQKSEREHGSIAATMIQEVLETESSAIGYRPLGTEIRVEINQKLFEKGTYAMIVHGLHIYDFKDFSPKSAIDVDMQTRKIVNIFGTPEGKKFGGEGKSFLQIKAPSDPNVFEGTEADLEQDEQKNCLWDQAENGICIVFDRLKDVSRFAGMTDPSVVRDSSLWKYKDRYYLMVGLNADNVFTDDGQVKDSSAYVQFVYKMAAFNLKAVEYSGESFEEGEDEFLYEHGNAVIREDAIGVLNAFGEIK